MSCPNGCSPPSSPTAQDSGPNKTDGGSSADGSGQCPPCNSAVITQPLGSLDSGANPVASWLTHPCHHFDFQGVVSGSPGPYVLAFHGTIDPAAHYTHKWTLEAGAGTLANDTSAAPTHAAPAAAGEGILRLVGVHAATEASCHDTKKIKIYQDHLARDRDNFGVGINCAGAWTFTKYGATITEPTIWNCFGSVDHAYNGSGSGYTPSVNVPSGWNTTIYDAPISAQVWATIAGSLHRGDVVSFWSGSAMVGYSAQHAHTSLGGATMYGANNEPAIRQPPAHPATWRWFETTSETYYNNVNSSPNFIGFLTRVKVHRKP